jgi:hypothetical protein
MPKEFMVRGSFQRDYSQPDLKYHDSMFSEILYEIYFLFGYGFKGIILYFSILGQNV